MLILATAHLYRTLAKDGVQWTGVTTAYIFALVLDAGLIALLIWCATGHAA
jgi:hypothetical protein